MSIDGQGELDRPETISVRDAVRAVQNQLRRHAVGDAPAAAEWAVAGVLGVGRAELRAEWGRILSSRERDTLHTAALRLAQHEPLQYVLGRADFLGRAFACDRRALIPRPETEELALAVLRNAIPDPDSTALVADVGTGTGCLAVSLALERPGIEIVATDIDADALDLARGNARRHGVDRRIRFVCCDLLGAEPWGGLDLVVSNPPYVERDAIDRLDPCVRDHEPRRALDGGPDGLDIIRRLAGEAAAALAPDGALWIEIGDTQAPAVALILKARGFMNVQCLRDLAGRDRFAAGRRPGFDDPI